MTHEYTYDPTLPGTRTTGLPRALLASEATMTADRLEQLMAEKRATIAYNTRELEKAYVKAEHVLKRFDRLIRSLSRLNDTDEIDQLLFDLKHQRKTAERLLLTGGLHRDFTTMTFKP